LALRLEGVSKRLSGQTVVDGVDLEVPRGSVFGFLGPNGAGKTTTIRIMVGLVFADAGSVEVLGTKAPKLRRVLDRVGALVESPGFVGYLDARENLGRLLAAEGVKRRDQRPMIEESLEAVGLTGAASRPVARFSLGMKQRLGLAGALLRPRDLYILDEPTNGLDPSGMREIRRVITDLSQRGATVVISTHLLSEAEQICTDVAFMSQGKIIAGGVVKDLVKGTHARIRVVAEPQECLLRVLDAVVPLRYVLDGKEGAIVPLEARDQVVRALVDQGCHLREVTPVATTLEDVFVSQVGEGFNVR